jgi:hypothetical protein
MAIAPVIKCRSFHLVKSGNASEDYEDAFAVNLDRAHFAIADGASEASFAGLWARLLTEGFVAARKPWRNLDWLEPLRQRWSAEVSGLPLPWYAEAKRDEGAFATFLGLAFTSATATRPAIWRALAIGDSCLFRLKAGRLKSSFPVQRSDDFSNAPKLLCSRQRGADAIDLREQTSGKWRPGDRFLLATDALAAWLLRQAEQGGDPAAEAAALLAESDPEAAFPGWCDERRSKGMRNDDVTLLVIDLPADESLRPRSPTKEQEP